MKRSDAFKEKQEAPSGLRHAGLRLGPQPFNRDDAFLAFGEHSLSASRPAPGCRDPQLLAGTGALVFEGELLELPAWN